MWLKSEDTMYDHPKVVRLSYDCRVTRAHAVGLVHSLHLWTLRMAPDGDLSSFDPTDIEIGAGWEGEPGVFFNALLERRLLDKSSNSLVVHDWWDYAGSLRVAQNRRRQRQSKQSNVARQSYDSRTNVVRQSHQCYPNVAVERRGEERRGDDINNINPDTTVILVSEPVSNSIQEAQNQLEKHRSDKLAKSTSGNMADALRPLLDLAAKALEEPGPESDSPTPPATTLAVKGEKPAEANVERISDTDLDSNDLTRMIDSERRLHKLTPYTQKLSDYQNLQDALAEVIAVAEVERVTPYEVVCRSLRNFYGFKDPWLHNNGYPIGAWCKKVGFFYKPPKPMKPEDQNGTGSVAAIYEKRTREFERKDREADERMKTDGVSSEEVTAMVAEAKRRIRK